MGAESVKSSEKVKGDPIIDTTALLRKKVERTIFPAICRETAAATLKGLSPGCEIFAFSKGQYSLLDIVKVAITKTGPADLLVTSWTMGREEILASKRLLIDKSVRSIRFLVDYSFPRRQPGYCALLREKFGDNVIRVSKCHAKFVLVRNDAWNLAIRSSANLNKNIRFEIFEISDSIELCDYLEGVVDQIFDRTASDETFKLRPQDHKNRFDELGGLPEPVDYSHYGVDLSDPSRPGISVVK